jgi:hypothetical protein
MKATSETVISIQSRLRMNHFGVCSKPSCATCNASVVRPKSASMSARFPYATARPSMSSAMRATSIA